MVEVVFDPNFEKNSRKVTDQRVWKVVERKFAFLSSVGMNYPSLNAKKLENLSHNGQELWEFYITMKWRCFFTYDEPNKRITVIKIGNHL